MKAFGSMLSRHLSDSLNGAAKTPASQDDILKAIDGVDQLKRSLAVPTPYSSFVTVSVGGAQFYSAIALAQTIQSE